MHYHHSYRRLWDNFFREICAKLMMSLLQKLIFQDRLLQGLKIRMHYCSSSSSSFKQQQQQAEYSSTMGCTVYSISSTILLLELPSMQSVLLDDN